MRQIVHRIDWIDYLRGLAIIAVVGNHLWGYAFDSILLRNLTGFSVSLFILLSGYTSAMALAKDENYFHYLKRRLGHILIPYLAVSIFYQLATSEYPLSLKLFLVNILTFSANPVLYFVFIYLQLVLVAPFIVKLFRNVNLQKTIILLILTFALGFAINRFFSFNLLFLPENKTIGGVYINGLVLGADKLFGGSYLFLFVLGIFLKVGNIVHKLEAQKGGLLIGSVAGAILIFSFKHGEMWSNPPNVWLIAYTLLVFGAALTFVFWKIKYLENYLPGLKLLGRNSLYIFILHPAFIGLANDLTASLPNTSRIIIFEDIFKQLAYWGLALAGPVLVVRFSQYLYRLNRQSGFLKFR